MEIIQKLLRKYAHTTIKFGIPFAKHIYIVEWVVVWFSFGAFIGWSDLRLKLMHIVLPELETWIHSHTQNKSFDMLTFFLNVKFHIT